MSANSVSNDISSQSWYCELRHVRDQLWNDAAAEFTGILQLDDMAEVDLSHIPAKRVVLRAAEVSQRPLTSSNAPKVTVALSTECLQLDLHLPESADLHFDIRTTPRRAIDLVVVGNSARTSRVGGLAFPIRRLTLVGCECDLRELPEHLRNPDTKVITLVSINEAHLSVGPRPISSLRMRGGWVYERDGAAANIDAIVVERYRPVRINISESRVTRIDSVLAAESKKAGSDELILRQYSSLSVKSLACKSVKLQVDSTLAVHGPARDVAVRGPGNLYISKSAVGLSFDSPPAATWIEPYAILELAKGRIDLRRCSRASIAGDGDAPGGFTIVRLPDEPGEIAGVSLSAFRTDVTLEGLAILSQLEATVTEATPQIHASLPGMNLKAGRSYRHPFRRPRLKAFHLEYAVKLSKLASIGNAPASVRTLLSWLTYRVRQDATSGRVERSVLQGYRFLGYGERPMPSFLTYVIIALSMCIISLADRQLDVSLSGLSALTEVFVSWLITPLHVFRLTSSSDYVGALSQPWDTLARLLVSVPFATGILTLRRYVKDDKSGGQ